jgi:hypothetical protein
MNLLIPYISIWPHGYPLTIAWWEENHSSLKLFFVAEEKPGLTRRIREYAEGLANATDESVHAFGLPLGCNVMAHGTEQSSSLLTLFNGPYGLRHDFSKYGTVVMFASGAGFAPLLAHAKVLVEGNLNLDVCTRRVALYWQIEKEGNEPLPLIALEMLTLVSITL